MDVSHRLFNNLLLQTYCGSQSEQKNIRWTRVLHLLVPKVEHVKVLLVHDQIIRH